MVKTKQKPANRRAPAKPVWSIAELIAAVARKKTFQRMSLSIFKRIPEAAQFGDVAVHIQDQVEDPPFKPDLAFLGGLPQQAQVVYWLWRFICEADGLGIETFLMKREGVYAKQVANALKAVGADELRARLLAGVPLAIATFNADFLFVRDRAWFYTIPRNKKFKRLSAIDQGLDARLYEDLRERGRKYIHRHQDVFINPRA